MRALLLTASIGWAGCAGSPAPQDGGPATPTDSDPPTGTGTGTGDPGGDPSSGTWLATYDLTGSHFYIQSMVDFTITVQEPYDADLNTGPGRVVMRLPDVGGQMGAGEVSLVEYQLTWDFVTGVGGFADVHTDIENQAGPEVCGLTTGALDASSLAWAPPEIVVCQLGQISCTGPFCGTSGAPPADEPEIVDACEPWALNTFTFSPDLLTFDMLAATVSSDDGTETAMAFHGTLVDAVAEDAPGCP